MIKIKPLFVNVLFSLAVGFLSAILTSSSQEFYSTVNLPPFAPPSFLFPIVWTILYLLMGVSAYIIYSSNAPNSHKQAALTIYAISLLVNFIWPFIFFNARMYLFAFFWIILLWLLIALTIAAYYKINKTAAYLQIPYFIWVTFAAILNLAIVILN